MLHYISLLCGVTLLYYLWIHMYTWQNRPHLLSKFCKQSCHYAIIFFFSNKSSYFKILHTCIYFNMCISNKRTTYSLIVFHWFVDILRASFPQRVLHWKSVGKMLQIMAPSFELELKTNYSLLFFSFFKMILRY